MRDILTEGRYLRGSLLSEMFSTSQLICRYFRGGPLLSGFYGIQNSSGIFSSWDIRDNFWRMFIFTTINIDNGRGTG